MSRFLNKSGDKQRSGPHRRVEDILNEMSLSFISEVPFPPYTVDIFLPEWHLGVEVDGPFHSKTKDRLRDAKLLQEYSLPILRINAVVWQKKHDIIDAVVKFIEDNDELTWQRKSSARLRP